ncbi:LysR family transcriptional regulator [uncultured Succinatimonas sp.]|uniref:LysR family transcriptional regulator n=1 Tax=uncultured Succinatimonas sp. TaxID=1262973 RepID=UPI0025E195AB|nr:LysR family transcriptional regulator [uncultured Succinatimonas sp.]
MSDFRLKVFESVAKNHSFTKAAQELCISQPAVTKHIRVLEDEYKVKLFNRSGSKIELTKAGSLLLQHAELILSQYNRLEYALHKISNEHVGSLKLGASTTIAQYVIPKYLAKFNGLFPKIELSLINDNSRNIESALKNNDIDLGLVEGVIKAPDLTYQRFTDDELVVITSYKNENLNKEITLDEFIKLPLVLREYGSGTLDVIEKELNQKKIKLSDLNIKMHLGSTEAIKRFIHNSNSIGIVSIAAIEQELYDKTLRIIDIDSINFKRQLCFVSMKGRISDPAQEFISFITNWKSY